MIKTGGQIEYDVYNLLKDELKTIIKGNVYLQGTRPFDAKTEDAVISFKTGLDGDIQNGKLTLNIYVADIDNANQLLVKNVRRCNEIEGLVLSILNKPKSEYQFSLGMTINTFAEPDIKQHFVNVDLKYRRFSRALSTEE